MRGESRWGPVVSECGPCGRVLSREMTRSGQSGTGKRAGCVWSRGRRGGRRWAGSYCWARMLLEAESSFFP